MKKFQKTALKILVSVALLGIIFMKVDKTALVAHFKIFDWRFAPLIILLIVANYFFSSVRWKALLIYENTKHITVRYLTSLYFIGSFFNNFMPTSVGGDVYKFVKLGSKIGNKTNAFSATFMERFTGVLILMLISLFSTVKLVGWWVILLFIGFLVAVVVGLKMLKFLSAKSKKIRDMYDSLMLYKNRKGVVVSALLTSIVVQMLAIFTQYFVFYALGVKLPIVYSMLIFPVITLASFFIPSLNGIGVQDYLYMNLFSVALGIPVETSLGASFLYHISRLSVSLVGGVLYAAGKGD